MDMPGMNMTGSTTMMPKMNMKHPMWMWFHTKPDDTVLFDFWMVKNAGQMVYSCFIIFAIAIIPEFIKYFRWKLEHLQPTKNIDKPYLQRLFHPYHLIQTVLFGIQLAVSYAMMLVFMTFNVWLGIAVVAGMTVGYLVFGSRQETRSSSSHF